MGSKIIEDFLESVTYNLSKKKRKISYTPLDKSLKFQKKIKSYFQ